MAGLLVSLAQRVPLTFHEALSGIFGSISLASWIFLLVPQLIENYKLRSADGISLAFVTVWFLGDITNLAGAIWAGLVPTVIVIAIYFCLSDLVLISQCLYYNKLNARVDAGDDGAGSDTTATADAAVAASNRKLSARSDDSDSQTPLLARRRDSDVGLPGSHTRRRSSNHSSSSLKGGRRRRRPSDAALARRDSLASIAEEHSLRHPRAWIKNALSVLAICALGVAGWATAYKSGAWEAQPPPSPGGGEDAASGPLGAQLLGYASAVCYLGARIPQIVKNARDRSCAGLSLLFFMLSLLGNATYGAGILAHSIERAYFLKNLPWLIGSLGTIAEDVTIFVQFRMYGDRTDEEEEEEEEEEEANDSAVIA